MEIIYNFRTAILQVVQTEQLLPLDTSDQSFVSETSESITSTEYLYEPTREEILTDSTQAFKCQIWKALLDSNPLSRQQE